MVGRLLSGTGRSQSLLSTVVCELSSDPLHDISPIPLSLSLCLLSSRRLNCNFLLLLILQLSASHHQQFLFISQHHAFFSLSLSLFSSTLTSP